MQQRQCFHCAETYLQVLLFITQAVDSFRFINQSVKEQLHGIKHLIVGNTTHDKVIIRRIFSTATVQNEIQPLFGIRIEFQRFQFSFPPFIIFIPGDNTIFPTAFELTTPLRRLFIQRRDIKATPEVYIGARMNQIRLCNFSERTMIENHTSTPLSFITSRRSSTIYSRLWVCSTSYSGTI